VSAFGARVVLPDPVNRTASAFLAAAAIAAVMFGSIVAGHPLEGMLLIALVPLALAAPLASFAVMLAATVLMPFDALNALSIGGGAGVPGLLPVDVLLGLGLGRVAFGVIRGRIQATTPMLVAGVSLVALLAVLVHGVAAGASVSDAGTEARCLAFGVGSFIMAVPLLEDSRSRARLYRVLLLLGIALGLWGIAQVVLNVPYSNAGDVGVRPGIGQVASVGGGQLQGGLYAFPIAVVMAFAGLVCGASRELMVRWLLAGVFGLNCLCVLLTYERSVWAASLLGCLAVAMRAGRAAWPVAARWSALGVAAVLAWAVVSPGALTTSAGRITSIFSVQSDSSAQSRAVESAAVLRAIRRSPVVGAGFGATLTWGGGNHAQFGETTTNFTHEGYLWLAWKAGVPFAVALVACLWFAALRRTRRTRDRALAALRAGCHAALLASLLVCLVFPEFNALGVTALLGLLLAVCVARADYRGRSDTGGASTTV